MPHARRAFRLATSVSSSAAGGTDSYSELWAVNVNKGVASAVCTVYDGPTSTSATVAVIDASSKSSQSYWGARFQNGFSVYLTGANADVTVTYS